ncbi:AimR family lysis-lysogeny pheromone receptor [Priestia megaterium]|uniref:AimR family lysis-lysogeny pheromone receptor n=1 Tax=Priestia megaterium TaxID=1404 RepID=UPI00366F8B4A
MIGNALETMLDCLEENIPVKDLARIAEVDVRTMRRYLYEGVEPGFCKLYKISRSLFKDDVQLIDWAYKLELPENIKAAMEYLSLNKNLDVLNDYIKVKVDTSTNKNLKRWGALYGMISSYEAGEIKNKEMLDKVRKVSTNDSEMKLLLNLVEANVCYRILSTSAAYLHTMSRICDEIEQDVYDLKDCFFRMSFEVRLNDLLGKRFLYVLADVEKAREHAAKNISQDICAIFKANSYYLLGTSFTFESYELSVLNTKQAIDVYREANYEGFADELERWFLPFLDAHHGVKVTEGVPVVIAHYEAKWGDKGKALEIIEKEVSEAEEAMYYFYYKGLATNDSDMLFKSLSQFLKVGDLFFAQLPLEQLRKSETLKSVAEAVYGQFAK